MSKTNGDMEAGEKELRKTFERTTIGNVHMVVNHSNETRRMVKMLEERLKTMENNYITLTELYDKLRIQYAMLQQKVSAGGTTHGDNG